MNARNAVTGRTTSLASGIAVTALVVVIGVAAAVADLGPAAPAVGVEGPIANVEATAATAGFRVPDDLRIDAGEVPAHVESF